MYKVLAASKKKLTEAMVKKLLSEGKVLVRGLMSERTGKTYDAYITMENTEKGVLLNLSFDNIPAKKTTGKKKGGK